VRNPYDRVISEYYCRWGFLQLFGQRNRNSPGSEAFNLDIVSGLQRLERMREAGAALGLGHWQEQVLYVEKDGRRLVPEENILRFERLDEELPLLFARYGLPFKAPDPPPHDAGRSRRFGADSLSERAVELVNRLFRRDFIAFGYGMRGEGCSGARASRT
jgi:hypothetical protein